MYPFLLHKYILVFGVLLPLYNEQSITKRYFPTLMNDKCIIRLFERQYYMGNYWTLYPNGIWTSYRKSNFKVPYGRFVIKSLRIYGPSYCRWKVCSIYTRKSRRRKCRLIETARKENFSSIRRWRWKNNILGRVYRLPNKHRKLHRYVHIIR